MSRVHQDQYLTKVFRVDREFVGGEAEFGVVGTCAYAHQEDEEISIMDDALSFRRVPISVVIEKDQTIPKPRELRKFEHVGKPARFQLLGRLGMVDAESSAPVDVKTDSGLVEGSHIQLWAVLLEHTFPQLNFSTWSPESLYTYFEYCQEKDGVSRMLFEGALRKAVSRYDKVLFPIQCPEGAGTHSCGHWTLLVIEARDQGVLLSEPRIRYYETLHDVNDVCQERALQVLRGALPDLSEAALVTALMRHQIFRQAGTECGYWVMHYMELEVRRLAGEGGAPVTTPKTRRKAMLQRAQGAARQLEKARQLWLQDAAMEEAKVQAAQQVLRAKADRRAADQKEAEELRRRAEEAALVSSWCSTLPDAIPEDPKEVRRRLRQEETQAMREEVQAALKQIFEAEARADGQKRHSSGAAQAQAQAAAEAESA